MSVQVDSAVIGGGVVGLAIARRFYPGLDDGTLQSGYTGIRPYITGPGEPVQDFTFSAPGNRGITSLLNIFDH